MTEDELLEVIAKAAREGDRTESFGGGIDDFAT